VITENVPQAQICLVFPHVTCSGPVNMARDEVLLDLAAADPSIMALRTYGWSEPTLSLGYFQSFSEIQADPRWRDVPVVRRPTGGGALWHDREMTYALAIPSAHPLARRTRDLYALVHLAIADLLQSLGAPARRRGEPGARLELTRPFLCFTDEDAEDIVIGAHKVVGSAQRRRSGAVLQHGSLLLEASSRTPELLGIRDLAALSVDPGGWLAGWFEQTIPRVLGRSARAQPWEPLHQERAVEREFSVYRNPGWTQRR
jgi:lipoyl(octanoyl) transferase